MRHNFHTKSITLAAGFATAVGVNQDRRGLIIFNTGAGDAFISLDPSSTANDIKIAAGARLEFLEQCPINAVSVKGTGTVVVWES